MGSSLQALSTVSAEQRLHYQHTTGVIFCHQASFICKTAILPFPRERRSPTPHMPLPAASNTGANLCKHKENSLCWFLALLSCSFSLQPLPWPLGYFAHLLSADDFHTYLSFPSHPRLHFFLLHLEISHEKSRTSAFPPEVSSFCFLI